MFPGNITRMFCQLAENHENICTYSTLSNIIFVPDITSYGYPLPMNYFGGRGKFCGDCGGGLYIVVVVCILWSIYCGVYIVVYILMEVVCLL